MSADAPPQPYETFDELAAVFRAHVAPNQLAYYQRMGLQLVMGRRQGIWFEDEFKGEPREITEAEYQELLKKPLMQQV